MANGIARAQAKGRGFQIRPGFTPRQVTLQKNPGGLMLPPGGRIANYPSGGNIGRFTRPSGFRGLAGTRAGIPNFARTYAVGPGEAGVLRARQQGRGFGGINPATRTRISGPGVRVGSLQRGPGQPRVQTTGVIQLGGRGIQPMRNPGNLATLAGRRAANRNQPNPVAQAKSRAGLNFTPKVVNPVARARARGRGF